MELKLAALSDIEATLALHKKYQIDTIAEEDKKDGFVTTPFTFSQLEELIEKEKGLFILKDEEKVLAYVMAASWNYWKKWPMFAHMIEGLPQLHFSGEELNPSNTYQYGPICIDKSVRGTSVLSDIFTFALHHLAARFPILITFVNVNNPRSFAAHKKLGLEVIQEFNYNGQRYYEMACHTKKFNRFE